MKGEEDMVFLIFGKFHTRWSPVSLMKLEEVMVFFFGPKDWTFPNKSPLPGHERGGRHDV
jgi:hypothetical protein